jgi:hypothetical protein
MALVELLSSDAKPPVVALDIWAGVRDIAACEVTAADMNEEETKRNRSRVQ